MYQSRLGLGKDLRTVQFTSSLSIAITMGGNYVQANLWWNYDEDDEDDNDEGDDDDGEADEDDDGDDDDDDDDDEGDEGDEGNDKEIFWLNLSPGASVCGWGLITGPEGIAGYESWFFRFIFVTFSGYKSCIFWIFLQFLG